MTLSDFNFNKQPRFFADSRRKFNNETLNIALSRNGDNVGVTKRREARFTRRGLLRQQYRTRGGEISGRKEKESLDGGTMEQWMKRPNSGNASRSLITSPTKGNKF